MYPIPPNPISSIAHVAGSGAERAGAEAAGAPVIV
jgi:hypothetical protein